ncbi:hypothetical protein SPM90_23745, partial [Enterobacter kobei]
LKMPAFEWVHVQLHQQKGMISLSPPTICNSAFFSGCWLKPVFRALYQQHAPLIYVTFATYEGTGSGR